MKYAKELRNYITSSYRTVNKRPFFTLQSFFVDLLFFVLFSVLYSFFSTGIIEHLIDVNNVIAEVNSQIALLATGIEDNAALSFLAAQQEVITGHIRSIAMLAIGILVSTYILWCIFQGINWHLASWVSHRKVHFLRFLGKFSLLNLVWLAALILIGYATYRVSVYNAMARIAVVGQNTLNYLMLLLVFVLFYFAVVSYSFAARKSFLDALKDAFVFGVRKAKFYVPAYVMIALLLAVIYFVVSLFRLNLMITVPLNLLFMLPAFAYGRVLFLEISADLKK